MMTGSIKKFAAIIGAAILVPAGICLANPNLQESKTMVALRMIGHQLLLRSGDSASLVLPVEKMDEQYQLTFESAFRFEPGQLVALVDSVVKTSGIANRYLVEVRSCQTAQVVYSYEMGLSVKNDMVPCTGRMQPKACYKILFTIIDPQPGVSAQNKQSGSQPDAPAKQGRYGYLNIGLAAGAMALIGFLFFRQKKQPVPAMADNSEQVTIGQSLFDKRNMTFLVNNGLIELTGKEAELLALLYAGANTTIEREVILNAVWGDEGDYAGRTLDVFISRLRKKIESDESLKIVNIRGVGYKLIVNG